MPLATRPPRPHRQPPPAPFVVGVPRSGTTLLRLMLDAHPRLTIPPDLAGQLTPDAALAVSLEPPGGSPTGQPTGPVIASGKLTSL